MQNVFESASDLVRDLSDLGMSLHIVRNVEVMLDSKFQKFQNKKVM